LDFSKATSQTFFSLAELNYCIKALLLEVNHKPFKQLKGTRQSWLDAIDKTVLMPLPKQNNQYTEIKQVKVNIDYHVQFDQHHKWTPGKLKNWASSICTEVLQWVTSLLAQKQHEQQAYSVCLGSLNLSKSYESHRLNNSCAIANKHSLYPSNK